MEICINFAIYPSILKKKMEDHILKITRQSVLILDVSTGILLLLCSWTNAAWIEDDIKDLNQTNLEPNQIKSTYWRQNHNWNFTVQKEKTIDERKNKKDHELRCIRGNGSLKEIDVLERGRRGVLEGGWCAGKDGGRGHGRGLMCGQ